MAIPVSKVCGIYAVLYSKGLPQSLRSFAMTSNFASSFGVNSSAETGETSRWRQKGRVRRVGEVARFGVSIWDKNRKKIYLKQFCRLFIFHKRADYKIRYRSGNNSDHKSAENIRRVMHYEVHARKPHY